MTDLPKAVAEVTSTAAQTASLTASPITISTPSPAATATPPAIAVATLTITVCYAPAPRQLHTYTLQLPAGARVADALALCAADARFADAVTLLMAGKLHCALRGTKTTATQILHQVLHQDDRLELCRGLRVDPKVARRERFAQQGARTTGLFAKRRPGAGAGY